MKVAFENVLLDLLGLSLMVLGAYGVSQLYTVTPFDKTWSRDKNALVFCGIPVVIYLVFRVYFGISFYITSKIPSKFAFVEKLSSFILTTAGIGYGIYQPKVQETAAAVYQVYVGKLPSILYDLSKPNVDKAYAFGLKILGLLCGWFVLLFAVELVLRVVIIVLGFVIRSTLYSGKKNKEKLESKEE